MKPAILIVHGAWHVPEHYELFAEGLKASGFDVSVPHLPTCGQLSAQSSLDEDVNVVHQQLIELVESSREVIIVAHSYGGAVATQALDDNFLRRNREPKGLPGGILHIIYMCAFMLQPGESCFGASQPRPDPDPVEPGDDGTSFLCQPGRDLFYNDVQDEGLVKRCEGLLVSHSLAALAATISYPAWRHLPTTYLKCTEDRVLFSDWQDRLIQAVKDSGTNIEVETYHSSHSPFLSMPKEMVKVVERTAGKYTTS